MFDFAPTLVLATRIPSLFGARTLHRAALRAAHRGAFETADGLFERAAERYRQDLAVEPLARLRVHQLIARVRSGQNPERETALSLEIEQRLSRLSSIESLEPPFGIMNAKMLQATWTQGTQTGHAHSVRAEEGHDANRRAA